MILAAMRKLLRWEAGKQAAPRPRWKSIRARYDAAQTTDNNRKHWLNADGLSANAANSIQVRRVLRNRTRYEVTNNSYAKGIVLTLANDCIGTGPRLQMLTQDQAANAQIEREFNRWCTAVGLAAKLRTMRMAKVEDGEAFALLTSNPMLLTRVKLDLNLIEADQVTTPNFSVGVSNAVDGIVFDAHKNPQEYHVLKQHPGDLVHRRLMAFDRVNASAVLHYFRVDRPGQSRGVPELTPALPLFAMLRDYTLATLDAAKAAACFAGILYTDAPPNGESDTVDSMDTIELERNMLLTMPGGWKMSQVDAKQPTSSYSDFKKEIIEEIIRSILMPYNIAAGNSSGYNYASGRLDHQVYFKAIRVEQAHIGTAILDRILRSWIEEAVLIEGLLPQLVRTLSTQLPHQWFWDGHEHVDPQKEANSVAIRLQNFTTTYSEEYGKRGIDWATAFRQRAEEKALMNQLGLTPEDIKLPIGKNQIDDQETEYAPTEAD